MEIGYLFTSVCRYFLGLLGATHTNSKHQATNYIFAFNSIGKCSNQTYNTQIPLLLSTI